MIENPNSEVVCGFGANDIIEQRRRQVMHNPDRPMCNLDRPMQIRCKDNPLLIDPICIPSESTPLKKN